MIAVLRETSRERLRIGQVSATTETTQTTKARRKNTGAPALPNVPVCSGHSSLLVHGIATDNGARDSDVLDLLRVDRVRILGEHDEVASLPGVIEPLRLPLFDAYAP
jgi:hypothetical protein